MPIPLPQIPRAVEAATGCTPPPVRKVYERALSVAFPAFQVNGRWFVNESDIPAVVAAFGMKLRKGYRPPAETAAPSPSRRRAEARPAA